VLYAKLLFMSDYYRYTVRFLAPVTHYAEVEAIFPTSADSLELFMAVWTPGSYLVREYSRHIEDVLAVDASGRPLNIQKTRKNRWRVTTNDSPQVRVTYRLYCHELSVRTNWVDEQFALLHGAATYLSVVGGQERPHAVTLILPECWRQAVSGMPRIEADTFLATNYDALVDSPILIGNPDIHEFECGGKKHYLVNSVADSLWDAERAVEDTRKIVAKHLGLWGGLPYADYWFLNILVEEKGGGGLEHKNSCALIASRYATRTRAAYVDWLQLVSHEFFHVWNVKRLRPIELGPFDYESENYTRGLWFAEGFTEYYGALMAVRAGVTTREEYFTALSNEIEKLQTTPGRFTRSVDLSSFDAWIKLYRPDDNSINSAISYYTKGAVIAFLHDARLRAAGDSLDGFMLRAFEQYSGPRGYSETAFPELNNLVTGTRELDYTATLQYFGLRFKEVPLSTKAWLGFTTKNENGRLIVSTVPRETPAYTAGFSADDEILAIGQSRVLPEQWTQRMEQMQPGDKLPILISRRGRITTIDAKVEADPGKRWTLEIAPQATAEQSERVSAWLSQTPRH
jgi:predicted metalloprotease with PDZ domain